MGINLTKGGNAALGASLQKFVVGMGWDTNQSDSGQDFDLDASAFMLGADGKVISDKHFIFFNNLTSPEGCVEHTGDNLTGAGDGDDESIKVDLSKMPANCESITFVVTIHDAEARRQNFGQVRNAFVRIYDPSTNEEILKYDLGEDFSVETAVEFGNLYKKDGAWKFKAIGTGYAGGLAKFVTQFGLSL
jgi:tellurium resistance protein TerD